MIGIYKITSPSGKIYIGQSGNITKRFYHYKSLNTKEQPRLNYSFLKYGVEKHIFEIIEETFFDLLNERERYWQEYYNVIGKNGLNCQLTNTKEKKILVSDLTKEKHKKRCGVNHPSFGKKRTDDQKKRMSIAQKKVIKKPFSEKTKLKISERMKSNTIWVNRKHSEKTKEKMHKINKIKAFSSEF